jgi:hypothetical protein
MGRGGDGERGRWGEGEMGRWGDGERGRWGDGGKIFTLDFFASHPSVTSRRLVVAEIPNFFQI